MSGQGQAGLITSSLIELPERVQNREDNDFCQVEVRVGIEEDVLIDSEQFGCIIGLVHRKLIVNCLRRSIFQEAQ